MSENHGENPWKKRKPKRTLELLGGWVSQWMGQWFINSHGLISLIVFLRPLSGSGCGTPFQMVFKWRLNGGYYLTDDSSSSSSSLVGSGFCVVNMGP